MNWRRGVRGNEFLVNRKDGEKLLSKSFANLFLKILTKASVTAGP